MRRRTHPNGLRDIKKIPQPRWVEEHPGLRKRLPILDHDAPVGTYLIDQVAIQMLRNGTIKSDRTGVEEVVRHARGCADIAAAYSIGPARAELTASSRHDDAKNFYENLNFIRNRARVACRLTTEEIAGFLSREGHEVVEDDDEGAEDEYWDNVAELNELLTQLAKIAERIDDHLREYRLDGHRPSSTEPLTNYFIFSCALHWESFAGQSLDKRDRSNFRRFLVAAWQDLCFPDPTDPSGKKKPIEDHIRERLAKSDVFDHF